MRVVIIGGTGHIGTYLSPRLVEAGHIVQCVSRGQSKPYSDHGAWKQISVVEIDRDTEEARGNFGERIARLEPEAVIDLTCYHPASATQIVDALRGRVQHFLHCGTVWVHGPSVQVPTTEEEPRRPFGEYGCHKATIEKYLLDQARLRNFPVTVLHPGHMVGVGWVPLNPAGNFNPQVFSDLAGGREVLLPNIGMETVHHVHADDVAQGFMRALARRSAALGESFHIVSPAAVTLRGYAERMALWFGQPANLKFLSWEEFRKSVSEKDAEKTWDHIAHSPSCSLQKARTLLGYEPRYGSLDAVQESVTWLIESGRVSRA